MLKVEIRFKGQINEKWSGWFGGLTVSNPAADETVLSGSVADSAALYGTISRLRDLGLQLTSVISEEIEELHTESPTRRHCDLREAIPDSNDEIVSSERSPSSQ
jgi:hypothetical protein